MEGESPTTIIGIFGNILFLIVQVVTYLKTKKNVSNAAVDTVKGTAAQTTVDDIRSAVNRLERDMKKVKQKIGIEESGTIDHRSPR